MRDGRVSRNRGDKRLLKKFLTIVCSIVSCFVVIASVGVFVFLRPASAEETMSRSSDEDIVNVTDEKKSNTKDSSNEGGFFSNLLQAPKKTNFLILGNDQTDLLADVIILGCFDSDTLEVNLINVPRDTYTTISSELRKDLEAAGRWIPQAMKINELHSYAGKELGGEAVKRKLEDSFDIKIDYIIDLDLDGFKQIVDTVGPIEMEIPAGGLHYYDPTQNLTINIPGGLQQLDGEMAEGVVRYRATYRRGDLQRIEVQQEFLKLLFKQTLQKETLIKNATSIISTIFEYVETDFELINLPKYLPYIAQLDGDALITTTLPGEARTLNEISYFIYDTQEAQELIDSVFKTYQEEEEPDFSSQNLKIQILNGSGSVTNALTLLDKLSADGLNVIYGGNYEGGTITDTRITVLKDGQGEDLKEYFNSPLITREAYHDDGFDIVIIIGENEFN